MEKQEMVKKMNFLHHVFTYYPKIEISWTYSKHLIIFFIL
jgi:hypothetical protein